MASIVFYSSAIQASEAEKTGDSAKAPIQDALTSQPDSFKAVTVYYSPSAETAPWAALLKALQKGGSLKVIVQGSAADAAAVSNQLTLSGFVSVTAAAAAEGSEAAATTTTTIEAAKPSWEAGAAARVTLKKREPTAATAARGAAEVAVQITTPVAAPPAAAAAPAKKAWNVAGAGAVELLDEDTLLETAEGAAPAAGAASGSAAACPPKRRACKNCTCGRKEEEDSAVTLNMGEEAAAAKSSACGSCFKGDAFRCATCPHLGKPAWKPDQAGAVLLDTSADI